MRGKNPDGRSGRQVRKTWLLKNPGSSNRDSRTCASGGKKKNQQVLEGREGLTLSSTRRSKGRGILLNRSGHAEHAGDLKRRPLGGEEGKKD